MDKTKFKYFLARYCEFDDDALAEVAAKADALTEEAAAAFATVLDKRGIDKTLLIQRAQENEESSRPDPTPTQAYGAVQFAWVEVAPEIRTVG